MYNNKAPWEIQYLTKEKLDGFDSYKVCFHSNLINQGFSNR